MKLFLLPTLVFCALPAAALAAPGLTADMCVTLEDGSLSASLDQPGAYGPFGVTVTLATNGPISGVQYTLLALYDADGGGPILPVPAGNEFAFVSSVSLSGKAAMPFSGPSRLHSTADGGIFDVGGNPWFVPGDYKPGHGPDGAPNASVLPTSLADAYPELVYQNGPGDLDGPFGGSNSKIATYSIASTGALAAGVYTITVGDQIREAGPLGFLACEATSPACVTPTVVKSVSLTVLPEPASGLLLVGMLMMVHRRRLAGRRDRV